MGKWMEMSTLGNTGENNRTERLDELTFNDTHITEEKKNMQKIFSEEHKI